MKDINDMSYEELLQLEAILENAKKRFYKASELYVIDGHFCTKKFVGNYAFLGSRTPVDYYDLFSGDFVGEYSILALMPDLKKVLDDCGIPYKEFLLPEEIKEIWNQYESMKKGVKRQRDLGQNE